MFAIKKIFFSEILNYVNILGYDYDLCGKHFPESYLDSISSIEDAQEHSLVFINDSKNLDERIRKTKSTFIICDLRSSSTAHSEKTIISVKNPKLLFARIVNFLFIDEKNWGIHKTATIHPEAELHESCYIGPNTYIGKASIGEGSKILGNCYIHDNVKIGNCVTIDPGCVIGGAGFGFVRDENGEPIPFPQLGGVIIEDKVEVGANSCIDRGALQDTIIKKGVKIDNLVQIAHNVIIGENTYIMGLTAIAGSVTIGKQCWIAPSKIINKVKIGDNVVIGYGAVVLNSVPNDVTFMGYPATDLQKYAKLQYKLKKL